MASVSDTNWEARATEAIGSLDDSLARYPIPSTEPTNLEDWVQGDAAYKPWCLTSLVSRLATLRMSAYRLYLDPERTISLTEFVQHAHILA